jgi:hypothetical protein
MILGFHVSRYGVGFEVGLFGYGLEVGVQLRPCKVYYFDVVLPDGYVMYRPGEGWKRV